MKPSNPYNLAACLSGLILLFPSLSLSAPDRFARFSTNPTRLYAGQTFDLTLAIYNTGDILDKSINISSMPPPDALRFEPFQELSLQQETMDNRTYEVRRFRSRATTPAAGSFFLAPSLQGLLIRETRSYFFVQRQTSPTTIPVEPFTLITLPLPTEGRPRSFSGAIGEFRLLAKATPLDIAIGDLVTIETRIEGIGLPETLPPPTLPPANGVKAYEAKPIPAESSATTHTFRQTVVPADPSLSALPALSFSFFNTRTGQYETQTAGPFPLTFHAERAPIQPVYTPRTNPVTITTPPPPPPAPGFWKRLLSHMNPPPAEQITLIQDTEVHLAPSESAITLFTLKGGSIIKVVSHAEEWIRIESPDGTGWIRK